ncbi:heavy metal translocating P-type ATPase [Bacillus daqingensis]|uniref:Cd(2+)-exporting ATPase n=1 Tax=Bacillus daqingensis TaxID=872396 RepID=A0ABV9NRE9_9BACI
MKTYQIEGLTCASCAARFEKNVKKIPSVTKAEVYFTSSKLRVEGPVSIKELERAGAFEKLTLTEGRHAQTKKAWWSIMRTWTTIGSGLLLAAGLFLIGIGERDMALPLFAGSILIGGSSLLWQGLKNLFSLTFDMKTLMTIAVTGAALIGEWAEASAVVFLFAISEWLESYSMDRARYSLKSLISLAPKEAVVDRYGHPETIPAEEVQVGDRLLVYPGTTIAADGKITAGFSTINQSSVTGESVPVEAKPGACALAGTLNGEGMLELTVTETQEDSRLAKIIHLVEQAQSEKAPAQQFIDRFAAIYTPAVVVLAAAVAVLPPVVVGGGWEEWIYRALALLVVACPCALVLSTPVAVVTALGTAAKNGVLIKGGRYLEQLGSIQALAFDKTGTLTTGKLCVTDCITFGRKDWMLEAAALEQFSKHPLAGAVVDYAEQQFGKIEASVTEVQSKTGKGLSGNVNGRQLFIGSPAFVAGLSSGWRADMEHLVQTFREEGKTVLVCGDQTGVLGLFALKDRVRAESKEILSDLKQVGLKQMIMLTGDHPRTAKALAAELGGIEVKAGLLPEEKLQHIKKLQHKYHKVGMAGDGVNDAPALAAADIGIAMGGAGTDAALETADAALMSDDLRQLPHIIHLSRQTMRIIRQNIFFSLLIKTAAVLLIVAGMLPLWLAVAADVGATLLVTLNGVRIAAIFHNKKQKEEVGPGAGVKEQII